MIITCALSGRSIDVGAVFNNEFVMSGYVQYFSPLHSHHPRFASLISRIHHLIAPLISESDFVSVALIIHYVLSFWQISNLSIPISGPGIINWQMPRRYGRVDFIQCHLAPKNFTRFEISPTMMVYNKKERISASPTWTHCQCLSQQPLLYVYIAVTLDIKACQVHLELLNESWSLACLTRVRLLCNPHPQLLGHSEISKNCSNACLLISSPAGQQPKHNVESTKRLNIFEVDLTPKWVTGVSFEDGNDLSEPSIPIQNAWIETFF